MKPFFIACACLLLIGCGGTRNESQRRSWATVWHIGHALENGGSSAHAATALQAIADRNAEAQGFKINKDPNAPEAVSHE